MTRFIETTAGTLINVATVASVSRVPRRESAGSPIWQLSDRRGHALGEIDRYAFEELRAADTVVPATGHVVVLEAFWVKEEPETDLEVGFDKWPVIAWRVPAVGEPTPVIGSLNENLDGRWPDAWVVWCLETTDPSGELRWELPREGGTFADEASARAGLRELLKQVEAERVARLAKEVERINGKASA